MKPMLDRIQASLLKQLIGKFSSDRQMPNVIVESIEFSDWGSLTFAGVRHRITLCIIGGDRDFIGHITLDNLIVANGIIAEADVTDIAAGPSSVSLTIEILVIGDG